MKKLFRIETMQGQVIRKKATRPYKQANFGRGENGDVDTKHSIIRMSVNKISPNTAILGKKSLYDGSIILNYVIENVVAVEISGGSK